MRVTHEGCRGSFLCVVVAVCGLGLVGCAAEPPDDGPLVTEFRDKRAPSVPGDVTASVDGTQVNLSWTASTDNVAVTGYRVSRDGAVVGTATGTSYVDPGLAAGATYHYTVAAYDAAKNTSAQTAPVTVTIASSTSTGGCALPAYPDASCTGVPAGTVLTDHDGDLEITTANTVIDGLNIHGCVIISAPGVVVRNSKMECARSFNDYSGTGALLEDVEIDGKYAQGATAVGDYNFTVRRANIHGVENGFDADGFILVEDSYIHDLTPYDPATDPHSDGMQITPVGQNITVRHNTILAGDGTSAVITPALPTVIANILIQDNLVAGGAYTVYCPAGGSGNNVRVIGNHFSTRFYPTVGEYGPWTDCEDEAEVSGNVYQETGLPVGF